MTHQTVTGYETMTVRASSYGPNFQAATVISTLSQSASEDYTLFPIPVNCVVTRASIRGSLPASGVSGQSVFKLGTSVTDNLFATFTVSGGGAFTINPAFVAVTVSGSDDLLPYKMPVVATVNSGSSATVSLSLYVLLEYVMPGRL